MIVEDVVKMKKRVYRKNGKEYPMYYVTFSINYSDILSHFKELQDVEVITEKMRVVLPKVNLFEYSYYVHRRTGQKVKQFSFVIPKTIAEKLEKEGIKKLKVIVEVPELVVKS